MAKKKPTDRSLGLAIEALEGLSPEGRKLVTSFL
jgi:hypothetical protein